MLLTFILVYKQACLVSISRTVGRKLRQVPYIAAGLMVVRGLSQSVSQSLSVSLILRWYQGLGSVQRVGRAPVFLICRLRLII